MTDEWSVEIKWQPNKESFIKEYVVYRDIEGATRKLAVVKTPSFAETSLDQEAAYTYYITAVSTDDVESPKCEFRIKTMAATKPPLRSRWSRSTMYFRIHTKCTKTRASGLCA